MCCAEYARHHNYEKKSPCIPEFIHHSLVKTFIILELQLSIFSYPYVGGGTCSGCLMPYSITGRNLIKFACIIRMKKWEQCWSRKKDVM